MRYSDRTVLLYLGSEVERMGADLGATEETQRDAIRLCGDVLRSGYDYKSVDAVASACFYLACTRQGEPISLPDIAERSRKPQKTIQHLSSTLMNELDIRLEPVDPDKYVTDGADHFEFDDDLRSECFDLLERAKERNLHSGLAPTTVAGAILYAVARKHRLDISQSEVSAFVGKSEVSIRNNFRDILELAEDVPVDVLPPQTVESAAERLQSYFDALPSVYAQEARELAAAADAGASVSNAGLVGGAYLAVTANHDESIDADEISTAVGVSPQTIRNHEERFDDEF